MIEGALEVGSILKCNPGVWTGTNPGDNVGPTDYSWFYSTDLTTPIHDGVSDNTYVPVAADLGKQLVCVETEEDFTDFTTATANSAPSTAVTPEPSVTITRFSPTVSGDIGEALAGVTVTLALKRPTGQGSGTVQVAAGTATTNSSGSWSATLAPVNPTTGPANAFGASSDALITHYAPPMGSTTVVPLDFSYVEGTLGGGQVQFQGLNSSISTNGLGVTTSIVGPDCSSISVILDGGVPNETAGAPGTPCMFVPGAALTDQSHVQVSYAGTLTDTTGAVANLMAIDDVGLLGTGPNGQPSCTADLVFTTVTCSNLNAGTFAISRNGGAEVPLTTVEISPGSGLFTGKAQVPGLAAGDTITLDGTGGTATTRHLTTLHVNTISVALDAVGDVLSGTCQPNKAITSGGLCASGGTMSGGLGGTEEFDDLSGGSTLVNVPSLSNMVPSTDALTPGGTWPAFADLVGAGTTSQVLSAVQSVNLSIAPRGSTTPAYNQNMTPGSDSVSPYETGNVGPLASGPYTASWLLTDSHSDTVAYTTTFVQQAGSAAGTPGTQGPQGAPGAPGSQGPTGQAGPVGPAGKNGNSSLVKCGTQPRKKTRQGTLKPGKTVCTIHIITRTIATVSVRISRHQTTYAAGSTVAHAGLATVTLRDRRELKSGRYRITIATASNGRVSLARYFRTIR